LRVAVSGDQVHQEVEMRATPPTIAAAVLAFGALAGGAASESTAAGASLPTGSTPVKLDPAKFTTRIDNPYLPLSPGDRWVYRVTSPDGVQRDVVTVTKATRRIADGIRARVVHDVVTEQGRLLENTFDWYAQDRAGNVWYLGEATKEYENGKVASTDGSWEAGVDGAQPGIAMPARPRVGLSYRQEYYAGEAEDAAKVLSLDEKAEVPFGSFLRRVLLIRETTRLEPKVLEYKLYAPNVGQVLALTVSGGTEREELVSYRRG
jgi:hypothetical protein